MSSEPKFPALLSIRSSQREWGALCLVSIFQPFRANRAAVGTNAGPRSPPSRRPLSSGTIGTRLKPKDLNGGGLKSHHSPQP